MKRKVFCLLASILVLTITTAWGQTIDAPVKLLASDGAAGDYFARSVSVSGDTAVAGAWSNEDNGVDSGAAYVFVRQAEGHWEQAAKLLPVDGTEGDRFGWSVSVDNNTVIVGAYADDDNGTSSGSAYVFALQNDGTWTEQAKLLPDDGAYLDYFGRSVSVSGDTVVVGAHGDDDTEANIGSAYVFVRQVDNSWVQQEKLMADDGAGQDFFGSAVSISGDTIVIGATEDDDNGSSSGSAYVFTRQADNTWLQQAKLLAGDGAAEDFFGRSVSISGNTAAIGAWGDDDNGAHSGSAYIFVRQAGGFWVEKDKLLSGDGSSGDHFGVSVAVSDNTLVVGAGDDDDYGASSGSAYVFTMQTSNDWVQQAKLLPTDGSINAQFGWSVAISVDTVVIGAQGDDGKGTDSGAAYVGYDSDGDNVVDIALNSHPADNCPTVWNPDQADVNYDGYGDACISPKAFIHQDASIGRFNIIGQGCIVDSGTHLKDFTTLADHVTIGRDVSVMPHLTVGSFSLINKTATLGEYVTLGSRVTIDMGVEISDYVTLGNRTRVDQLVDIGSYVEGGIGVEIGREAFVKSGARDAPTIIPDYEYIPKEATYPPAAP